VHTDQLTGSNIITNSADAKDETIDYFPFGGMRIDIGSYNNQRKFIGQIFDANTGLNYLNARYYDSTVGRFISQDSAFWQLPEEVLIDPQQQNCYSYARNNPINLSDPSGKMTIQAVKQTLINGANSVIRRISQSIRPQVIMPALAKSIPRINMDVSKTQNYNEKFASIEEGLVGKSYIFGGNGPNSVDCSGAIIYGIRQSVDPNFGDHVASALFRNYSIPSDGTGIGTVIFYDYNSDHKIDHVTTYVGNSLIVQPSSGAGKVLLKAINYLDKYTLNQGGKIYYRQLDWQKIISGN
jgi:RHS repeat-associated protein